MKYKILGIISTGLFLIGTTMASSASFLWIYQPKTPKAFQK
jgi:cyclic lactone autoinducer peptide